MVSKADIKQCASEDVRPNGGGLSDLTSIGKENKEFLVRVWESLPNKCILKP